MSAIAGVWSPGAGPDPRDSCARMLSAQAVYGPHAVDQWDGGEIALGRRLFRTVPEDVYDRQPLIGGGRFALAADVRLDNRDQLEAALDLPGDLARHTCDAALLLAAWEKWAENCFDRLAGCYAFALWDRERQALHLARDPAGQRPLHYHRGSGFWAFASMPKGLHALEEVPRAPDEAFMRDFLALMPEHGSQSFFAGIDRVEPGCVVTITGAGLTRRRHWNPVRRTIGLGGDDDYAQALREQLDQAVKAQLRGASANVGAQLSGGLDSSAVAATAARLLAPGGGAVTAFTSVPREGYTTTGRGLVDEGPLAAATAALYPNIQHALVRPTHASQIESLDRDHFLYDRPILNLCNSAWTHEIYRLARERGLAVMLTGLLGNLTFSYDGLDLLSEHLAHGRLRSWFGLSRSVMRAGTRGWRGVVFHSLGPWTPGKVWNRLLEASGRYGGDLDHYSTLNPQRFSDVDLVRRSKALGADPYLRPSTDTFADRVASLQGIDMGNYNKGALGGWGIDVRDPTADRRLVEFCLSVPIEQYTLDGRPRSLARRALADRLPEAVLAERRRGQQAADWHETLTAGRGDLTDWVERFEGCPPAAAALDLPRIRQLISAWPKDGWERNEVLYPYRYGLLRGLSAGHFLHRASGSNR